MQSYQIQVNAFKGDITQYKNYLQYTEETWFEYPNM